MKHSLSHLSGLVDLPVCLRLRGVPALIVGGGLIAEQRCRLLLEVGARVTLVAPEITPELARWSGEGRLILHLRAFQEADLSNQRIVLSATGDEAVSSAVHALAQAKGLLINTADQPERCDFTLPSVGRRGPISVAVSTSGLAPALAARLQRMLTAQLDRHHEQWARVQGFLRGRLPGGPARMALFKHWVNGPVGELFLAGERKAAIATIRADLAMSPHEAQNRHKTVRPEALEGPRPLTSRHSGEAS